MKMRTPRALVLIPLLLGALPGAAVHSTGKESTGKNATSTQADIEAVRAIGRTWQAHYTSGNYDAIPDLYTVDTIVMPRGRPRIEGRERLRESIGGLAAGRRVDIEVTEREIVVAGDIAWFIGDFKVTYRPKDGAAVPETEMGRSMILFKRGDDGRWRVHRDIDSPAPRAVPQPPVWNPQARTEPTACDRLASGRYDRDRLAPAVARADIDVPAAIRQCEADLAKHPGDARIHFHLGRLYGYAGDVAKTRGHREAAAAAGNPNAIFLLGYLAMGQAKTDAELCASGDRMKLAADRGNYSARIAYSAYVLEGRLAGCADVASVAEVRAYVKAARSAADGFFETLLAEHLDREATQELNARR